LHTHSAKCLCIAHLKQNKHGHITMKGAMKYPTPMQTKKSGKNTDHTLTTLGKKQKEDKIGTRRSSLPNENAESMRQEEKKAHQNRDPRLNKSIEHGHTSKQDDNQRTSQPAKKIPVLISK
uniref:hypothetical protein n=1 Tax=Klebsiella pneumoniae TaxID=573 RepID=UPI003EBAD618